MDITKTKAAIGTALSELNALTDAAFKARQVEGMPALTRAAKHLEDSLKHLDKAVQQTTPKTAKA
jgi:hypothetical protein